MQNLLMKNLWSEAVGYFNRGDFKNCIHCLQNLLAVKPGRESFLLLGHSARKISNYLLAERAYHAMLKINRYDPDAVCGLAGLSLDQGNYVVGERYYTQAIKFNPNHYDAIFNLARYHKQRARYAIAAEGFESAAKLKPNSPNAKIAAAQCYLSIQKVSKACAILEELDITFVDNIDIKLNLAALYKRQSQFDHAYNVLKSAELNHTKDSRFINQIAEICFLAAKFEESETYYLRLLEFNGENITGIEGLAKCKRMTQSSDWQGIYQSKIAEFPHNIQIVFSYALALTKLGNTREAYQTLAPFKMRVLDNATAASLLGLLEREEGNINASCMLLNSAVKVFNTELELKKEYAVSLMTDEQLSSAEIYIDQLVSAEPWNKGWVAHKSALLKLLGKDGYYCELNEYQRFVKVKSIEAPESYASVAEFNQQLLQDLTLLHQKMQSHPIDQSMRHGTQTLGNLFDLSTPSIRLLKRALSVKVEEYINELDFIANHPLCGVEDTRFEFSGSWSVRLQQAGYHRNHYHHKGWISACYYVKLPGAINTDGQGWIEFGQPDISKHINLLPDYVVKPLEGDVVLFPSYMWHGTRPLIVNAERITVAFDIVPREFD